MQPTSLSASSASVMRALEGWRSEDDCRDRRCIGIVTVVIRRIEIIVRFAPLLRVGRVQHRPTPPPRAGRGKHDGHRCRCSFTDLMAALARADERQQLGVEARRILAERRMPAPFEPRLPRMRYGGGGHVGRGRQHDGILAPMGDQGRHLHLAKRVDRLRGIGRPAGDRPPHRSWYLHVVGERPAEIRFGRLLAVAPVEEGDRRVDLGRERLVLRRRLGAPGPRQRGSSITCEATKLRPARRASPCTIRYCRITRPPIDQPTSTGRWSCLAAITAARSSAQTRLPR